MKRRIRVVFSGVQQCVSICLCVCLQTTEKNLLTKNPCNLVGVCAMANARTDEILVTVDLDL